MKPWREIAIPHSDVLKGTFQQAEFAVDLTAVQTGSAPDIYKDASAFFARTYITEGMSLLLTQVAQRLAGKGGEPVIQLQTAFGGGKTHTMLAVWHLATRKCEIKDMAGIPALIERAGLMSVPRADVAVIDGNARGPGSPKTVGKTTINTLWGELAWQLGGTDAFAMVREADATGTSPGKDLLVKLLQAHAPCVVLVDELVAYVRQFSGDQPISGGTYDSNLSFIQALTEAVKQVPNAVILASLPESEVEAGSNRGVDALRALEKIFGRLQALWRPVATEEGFEIVRRRLFEPIRDENTKAAVCKAFADAYVKEGNKLPNETQQARYLERLNNAYPIHPELFDRLYEDWTTIDGFQRTRGVLKLMAKVIFRLWRSNNQDLMIMPGSLPLDGNDVRTELAAHLPPGWHPVIESDIDGEGAESTDIDVSEPRFGAHQAARRVARTLFLGSAPASVAGKSTVRGLDKARILLGCMQPNQSTAVYSDALSRIADRLTYLNIGGDRSDSNTRYWFDTRANLRREMEDRKRRFDDNTDVHKKIEECARRLFSSRLFDGVHVFTPHADVPDDTALRLVVLSPKVTFSQNSRLNANIEVHNYLKNHGNMPRHRANRLVFVAADGGVLERLKDGVRTALAWESIVEDIKGGRLNIDLAQKSQSEDAAKKAAEVLPGLARECFKWLLCPMQEDPTETKPHIEDFKLGTSGGTVTGELERACKDNELIIETWAPVHLRDQLKNLYWKGDKATAKAKDFWEDSHKYLYLPRLRSREVFDAVIRAGSKNTDFFGTAYGYADGRYDGFKLGTEVAFDDAVLLVEPAAAKQYATMLENEEAARAAAAQTATMPDLGTISFQQVQSPPAGGGSGLRKAVDTIARGTIPAAAATAKEFRGSVEIDATMAKRELVTVVEEIVALLTGDPNAAVKLTLEISAEFPNGVSDNTKRSVSENAKSLKFKLADWE